MNDPSQKQMMVDKASHAITPPGSTRSPMFTQTSFPWPVIRGGLGTRIKLVPRTSPWPLFGAYAIFVTALFIFVEVGYFLQAFCRAVVKKLTSTQRSILAISGHVFFVLPCHLDLMLHMNNARYVWDRFTGLKGLPKNETPLGHS